MNNRNIEIIEFIEKKLIREQRILDVLIETKRVYDLTDNEILSYIDKSLINKMREQELKYGTITKGENNTNVKN